MSGLFSRRGRIAWALALATSCFPPAAVWGEVVTLKNNVRLEGSVGEIDSLNTNPLITPPAFKAIVFVDDDLRRIFVGSNQLAAAPAASSSMPQRRIMVPQRVAKTGAQIFSVGMPIRIQPFDDHGWRVFTMVGPAGKPIDVVQGITLVTPTYTKLEALQMQTGPGYVWTTRIATSSIPREQLSRILQRVAGKDNSEKRLEIVKLYIQADRIQDARAELEEIIKDFPELTDLKSHVEDLRQAGARLLLKEIELRRDSGQPRLALAMLKGFPKEGVAGETLLSVRDELAKFEELEQQGTKVLNLLKEHQATLDPKEAAGVKAICDEIAADLNIHTLDRMADYIRLSDDATMSTEQKLSLAISGWLLGSGAGIDNMSVSKSLVEVRRLVRAYLNSRGVGQRKAILEQLAGLEGSSPEQVSRLIAHMKPSYEEGAPIEEAPIDLGEGEGLLGPAKEDRAKAAAEKPTAPPPAAKGRKGREVKAAVAKEKRCDEGDLPVELPKAEEPAPADAARQVPIPGFYERTCKGPIEQPLIKYYVQLPPEYDPYRRYPVIVTLNGAGRTPQQQIDWWAGDYDEQTQMRAGQASRHGYIVIAPVWQKEFQRKYEYSLREHACVLNPLRDAFRRFAVDTDRVFLTGHSMGGDAAWDIGLAHPDLWAGVVPIVASADKYVRLYWENAAYLPMYFISGERDGNKLADNAVEWDRYLTNSSATLWDIMVIQYLGRGHERYHDDIQNLFTWMNLHKRNFLPTSFKTRSMRPWDSFFWYVEAAMFPENNMVHPIEWTGIKPPRATPATVEGKIVSTTNNVNVDSSARKVTVWLSPEMVNFDAKLIVSINNKSVKGPFKPKLEDLLEDVRTRGDRQHPFWLKVQGGQ